MRPEDIPRAPHGRPRLRAALFSVPAAAPDDDVREELREALDRLRKAERKLAAIEALEGIDKRRIRSAITHVQMYSDSSGYVLADADEPPPERGEIVEVAREGFVVERLAPSPFPDDLRRCAILRRT
jgi:hypothetical protein